MIDRTRCAAVVLVILGLGFIISGVLLFVFGDTVIESGVKKGCQLTRDTPAYKAWRHPPVPLHIAFYVFNITNPNALNESATPIVQQIGPFVYEEVRTKVDVEEYENGTISYRELRNYTFIPSLSVGDDKTTLITTINIVYMTLVNYLHTEDADRAVRTIVGGLLSNVEKPIMQRTVYELLWGYNDTLLNFTKQHFPTLVSTAEVSVYYASVSGAGLNTFLINSGVDVHKDDVNRLKQVGNIEGFNGQSTVSYWSNDYANMINGTDSTIWHPDAHNDDEVYIFSPDVCRSFRLEYQEKRKNPFGIDTYRFVLPGTAFSNSKDHQDFCLNITHNKTYELECLPDGLMSMRTCIKLSGSSVSIPLPIFSSFPHFLDADPSVQNGVQGLSPDEVKHRSFMDVEPMTGTVMNGSRKLQVNLNVENDSLINFISKYKSFVFPLIWLDEHAEIDANSASEFHSDVSTPITILNAVKYLLLTIGAVLFIIVVVLIIRNHHQTSTTGMAFAPPPDETSPLCS